MHMGCLDEEIDAHEISEQRNRCTWGVPGEEIDAHDMSGRRNRCTWGVWPKKSMHMNLQDQEINAQDPNLCIDIFSAFPKKNQCT